MTETALGWWGVPLAVFAGAMRSSTPFLFVSLGELLTEKSGRINLGQEGILVLGAMCGYGVAFLSGSPWLGVLVAGCAGAVLGSVHAALCSLPRVNDIALGIAVMLFGTGLAFYLGKPFIQPQAPRLPAIPFGWWSSVPQVQAALQGNVLFLLGAGLAPVLAWGLTHTRWGLIIQTVGDSVDAARALGYSVTYVRWAATTLGGFLAGIGGSFLSLYYPGSWNEGLSSGQGLMAVALVIFARWEPLRNACVPRMSVTDNLVFRRFDRPPLARGGWWLQFAAIAHFAHDLITRYRVVTPSPQTPLANLSGGNVQRTVLARELSDAVEVLIAANPCFGLDIAAAAEIRSQIMAARNRGTAVLLVSEDLDELLVLADRILVMSNGQIVYETPIQTTDVAIIGHHMAAH